MVSTPAPAVPAAAAPAAAAACKFIIIIMGNWVGCGRGLGSDLRRDLGRIWEGEQV